jgi:hypothetical protein
MLNTHPGDAQTATTYASLLLTCPPFLICSTYHPSPPSTALPLFNRPPPFTSPCSSPAPPTPTGKGESSGSEVGEDEGDFDEGLEDELEDDEEDIDYDDDDSDEEDMLEELEAGLKANN